MFCLWSTVVWFRVRRHTWWWLLAWQWTCCGVMSRAGFQYSGMMSLAGFQCSGVTSIAEFQYSSMLGFCTWAWCLLLGLYAVAWCLARGFSTVTWCLVRVGFQYSGVMSRTCWISVQWRDVSFMLGFSTVAWCRWCTSSSAQPGCASGSTRRCTRRRFTSLSAQWLCSVMTSHLFKQYAFIKIWQRFCVVYKLWTCVQDLMYIVVGALTNTLLFADLAYTNSSGSSGTTLLCQYVI